MLYIKAIVLAFYTENARITTDLARNLVQLHQ